MPDLNIPPIILASQSPRRHELLILAGIKHEIFVSGADEDSVEYIPGKPEDYVLTTAELKNNAVRDSFSSAENVNFSNISENPIVLSADTVVYSDISRKIFGKPKSPDHAFEMLRELSGVSHRVITGVVLHDMSSGKTSRFAESTEVRFRPLDDSEIKDYIQNFPPLDKAGAYGIQDRAAVFVEKITGDYYNIVGLPVCKVFTELQKLAKSV